MRQSSLFSVLAMSKIIYSIRSFAVHYDANIFKATLQAKCQCLYSTWNFAIVDAVLPYHWLITNLADEHPIRATFARKYFFARELNVDQKYPKKSLRWEYKQGTSTVHRQYHTNFNKLRKSEDIINQIYHQLNLYQDVKQSALVVVMPCPAWPSIRPSSISQSLNKAIVVIQACNEPAIQLDSVQPIHLVCV